MFGKFCPFLDEFKAGFRILTHEAAEGLVCVADIAYGNLKQRAGGLLHGCLP